MTYASDTSDFAAPTADLHEQLDLTCRYHTVTRPDIQERMQTVRDGALIFAHGVIDLLPRSPERDRFVEGVGDVVQLAISSLARYQELVPEYDVDVQAEAAVDTSPTAGMAVAPGHYVDSELVHKIVTQATNGHGIPIDQYLEQYRKVMRALSES